MTDRAWTRTGRPRAATMPVAPPTRAERLLVDRGDLVVPLDDARLGRATVGAVLRSLRSVGIDDVAPDVDEAAWRLQRALRRPTASVTPWLDGLLWRVPRAGRGPRPTLLAALAAALLRGIAVAAAWTLCIVPFLIIPREGFRLVALDGAVAAALLLATGIAGCVRALILLLESLEGGANGVRLGTAECVLSVLGILWGSGLTVLFVAIQGPTWLSLHAWMTAPAGLALAIAITACVLDDAVPGGARRRRAVPRQSMPRASVLERYDALHAVADARMADLDPEQARRLDAAVAAAVRDLHARGQVDASTRDLLLRGTADPGFDMLPTVLLAIDPGARVPVGATVPQGALRAVLVESDVAMRLTTAIPLLGVRLEPSTWHEAPNANAAELRRQQSLRAERDRHVDPIALARTPVLDDRESRGLRGMLAVAWRVPVWLSAAGAIWAALMALVIGLASDAFTPVTTWITWIMLLVGLAGAIGWALALDAIEAIQRHRSRAALTLWQVAGLIGALAAAVTLGHDRHVDDGLAVLQALTLAAVGIAIVGSTVRRIAWWRGQEPTRRAPKVGEWPIRIETAHRVDAARRAEAAARRDVDPEAFDELRARLAALALVPIAMGHLDARALDDQHA